ALGATSQATCHPACAVARASVGVGEFVGCGGPARIGPELASLPWFLASGKASLKRCIHCEHYTRAGPNAKSHGEILAAHGWKLGKLCGASLPTKAVSQA